MFTAPVASELRTPTCFHNALTYLDFADQVVEGLLLAIELFGISLKERARHVQL